MIRIIEGLLLISAISDAVFVSVASGLFTE